MLARVQSSGVCPKKRDTLPHPPGPLRFEAPGPTRGGAIDGPGVFCAGGGGVEAPAVACAGAAAASAAGEGGVPGCSGAGGRMMNRSGVAGAKSAWAAGIELTEVSNDEMITTCLAKQSGEGMMARSAPPRASNGR